MMMVVIKIIKLRFRATARASQKQTRERAAGRRKCHGKMHECKERAQRRYCLWK